MQGVMTKRVKIKAGESNVQLPNGGNYDAGDEVDLTEEEFAQLDPDAVGTVLDDISTSAGTPYLASFYADKEQAPTTLTIPAGGSNVKVSYDSFYPEGDHGVTYDATTKEFTFTYGGQFRLDVNGHLAAAPAAVGEDSVTPFFQVESGQSADVVPSVMNPEVITQALVRSGTYFHFHRVLAVKAGARITVRISNATDTDLTFDGMDFFATRVG